MLRGKKVIVAIIIVVLTLSYLVYAGVKETMIYYLTISEMIERVPAVYDNKIRVSGNVVPGSIKKELDGRLEFVITDGEHNVEVKYKGVIPDVFRDEVEAIVEGTYTPENVFHADLLLAKCPTKYESTEGLELRKEGYRKKDYEKGVYKPDAPPKGESI